MSRFWWNYLRNIGASLSQMFNVVFLFGDPDETTSSRIGKSYHNRGWAYYIPWPQWMRDHWLVSVEADEGKNSAAKRKARQ